MGAVDDKGTVVLTGPKVTVKPGQDDSGFFFSPTSIVAKPGTVISVTVTNSDVEGHNFSITALGIHESISTGESKTFRIKVPRKSPLTFFCSFWPHLGAGMQGAIVPSS